MDPFLKNNPNIRKVWRLLKDRRLDVYADQIVELSKHSPFYSDKFNEYEAFDHLVGMDLLKEELSNLLKDKCYEKRVNILKEYSHSVFLRNIIRLSKKAKVEDISYEYNDFSDLLMLETDRLIKEIIGPSPSLYSIARLGSKGRIGSDLFSDFDVVFISPDGVSNEESMYFELYASRFFNLFKRFEYLVDFPINVATNQEKKALILQKVNGHETMYKDRGRFEIQNVLGRTLTANLSEYREHFSQGLADNVERTAVLDIHHVIGDSKLSDGLVDIVKKSLLSGEQRIKFLDDLKKEFKNDKTKTDYFNQGNPDLKKSYGCILTITKLSAYLKTLMGEYYTHPHLTFSAAQKKGIITPEEERGIIDANNFLRNARNWIHLRSTTLSDYVQGNVNNYLLTSDSIQFDLQMKPNELERRLNHQITNVQKIVEKVISLDYNNLASQKS